MADLPSLSLQQRNSQVQKQTLSQTQKLSQQQLLSIKLLAMGSQELRREIYDTVAKNPALIITRDSSEEGLKNVSVKGGYSDGTKMGSATQAGKEASDNFQLALESAPDCSETLSEHLEKQFLSVSHSPQREELGLKLIYNLDQKGFHILSPYSFLDKNNPLHTTEFLYSTMDIIRQLDPVGTCCRNFEESLFVQAKFRNDAPPLVLFILNGHFDFLNPAQPGKIIKKVKEFQLYTAEELVQKEKLELTEEAVEKALEYIKTLDPFPAREFTRFENQYISPDVYIEKDEETGELKVRVDDEILPVVEISRDFKELSMQRTRVTKSTEESEAKRSQHRFIMDSIRAASDFLDSIAFRRKTLLLSCQQIVSVQKEFFEKGQAYLKPLRQKDVAQAIGVSEATISRIASGKYIACPQGLFSAGYFFTNAVGSQEQSQGQEASKTSVMYELQQILLQHKDDKKPLSDQKLSDLLSEKGIKIARRTVAKYRSQLNIDSSYTRQS